MKLKRMWAKEVVRMMIVELYKVRVKVLVRVL